jgi:nucleoside-diphosphate-sugar epimerase
LVLLARDATRIPDDLNHYAWKIRDIHSLTVDDLHGIDVVIHAAAKAHDASAQAMEYTIHNEQATQHLMECAKNAGVKRFVFISTIKVNGEYTLPGKPFTANDIPHPTDAYAISKLRAEKIVQASGMEWVIVRPPLVYGPDVKGNLRSLQRLIRSGLPLPLGAINNRRSLIARDNLVDALWQMVFSKNSAGKIFLISDGKPVSTPELISALAQAMGKRAWLLSVPISLLKLFCRLIGKNNLYLRLTGSLEIDDAATRTALAWTPPVSFRDTITQL